MRDLRRYASQTQIRLIIGGVLLLIIVGDGLIYWRYGSSAAVMGLICLAAGLVPIALIVLILWFMDWIVHNAKRK